MTAVEQEQTMRSKSPTKIQDLKEPAEQSVVAVCDDLPTAKHLVTNLRKSGIPRKNISLIASSLDDMSELHGYVDYGDHSEEGAAAGAIAGGVLGMFVGMAFFWVPGFGPLVILGPLAGGATGTVVGALIGAITGWGVPEENLKTYEQLVKEGHVIVIVHGDPLLVANAARQLQELEHAEIHVHAKTSADSPEIHDPPSEGPLL